MKQRNNGFTLIEILISLGIFALGLSGILVLFPVGINAVQKSTEDTTAMFITESLHAALRASALKTEPGEELHFFFDGLSKEKAKTKQQFISSEFSSNDKAIGIPGPINQKSIIEPTTFTNKDEEDKYYRPYLLNHLDECYAFLGKEINPSNPSSNPFGLVAYNPTADNPTADNPIANNIPLKQYSYNIQIAAPAGNPTGLYDITFRIRRNNKVIKVFYTQLMIPTSIGN